MSIRDRVIDNLYESDICYDYVIESHLREDTKVGLVVYPGGDLVIEEISEDYHGHGYVLESTSSSKCHCNACVEWNKAEKDFKWGHATEEQMDLLNTFTDKRDFIEESVYVSDEASQLQDHCTEKVEYDIDEGFFDDEERPVDDQEAF